MQLLTRWWVMFRITPAQSGVDDIPIYISVIPSSALYFFLIMADFGERSDRFVRSIAAADHRPACIVDVFPGASRGARRQLSKDYSQRTTLNGLSMFFGWIGGAGIAYVTNAHFLGGSYDNEQGYRTLAYGAPQSSL